MYSLILSWMTLPHVDKHLKTWALLLATILSVLLGCGPALAGDEEQRMPDYATFNKDATLITYIDVVTAAGEMLANTTEIWTVSSDGKNKRQLTKGHLDFRPRFSPDGKHIIFERDGSGEIWMMDVNGEDMRNLTQTPDVKETDAYFSNDGNSLFFLAYTPYHMTNEQLAAKPRLALGIGANKFVVQLNLKDGTRRQLLGQEYGASAVFTDPSDDKTIFVLCNAFKADGTPDFLGETVVVSMPLGGGEPHTFYTPPKGYDINMARSNSQYLVLSLSTPDEFGSQTFLLSKADGATATTKDLKKLENFTFLGDLSYNGQVIGRALTNGTDHWGLIVYDIAADKWHTVLEH